MNSYRRKSNLILAGFHQYDNGVKHMIIARILRKRGLTRDECDAVINKIPLSSKEVDSFLYIFDNVDMPYRVLINKPYSGCSLPLSRHCLCRELCVNDVSGNILAVRRRSPLRPACHRECGSESPAGRPGGGYGDREKCNALGQLPSDSVVG